MLYPVELQAHVLETCIHWSGQGDLNSRPPAPKAGALPDCAMPRGTREAYATFLAHRNHQDKISQLHTIVGQRLSNRIAILWYSPQESPKLPSFYPSRKCTDPLSPVFYLHLLASIHDRKNS